MAFFEVLYALGLQPFLRPAYIPVGNHVKSLPDTQAKQADVMIAAEFKKIRIDTNSAQDISRKPV